MFSAEIGRQRNRGGRQAMRARMGSEAACRMEREWLHGRHSPLRLLVTSSSKSDRAGVDADWLSRELAIESIDDAHS
jgi:hypothetical protein